MVKVARLFSLFFEGGLKSTLFEDWCVFFFCGVLLLVSNNFWMCGFILGFHSAIKNLPS